jgi:hypothetical protein
MEQVYSAAMKRLVPGLYAASLALFGGGAAVIGACSDAVGPDGPVVGSACEETLDCANGSTCLTDPEDFPGGMCSHPCKTQGECPEGSACVTVGNGQCVLACPDGTGCRDGLGCKAKHNQADSGESQVCINDDDL